MAIQRAPMFLPGSLVAMPVTRLRAGRAEPPMGGKHDPLTLGQDALSRVLASLDSPVSLMEAVLVSKGWNDAANQEALWRRHCLEAMEKSVYAPAAQRTDLPWKRRYLLHTADAGRTALTAGELCAFRWRFRFKPQAGGFWLAQDPYWTGEGAQLERLFSPDGSIAAPPGDPLWGVHESRWRFCKTQGGVRGHFIKVNHWPSLTPSRTADGGWVLQNTWVVYEAVLQPNGPYCRGIHPGQERHLC